MQSEVFIGSTTVLPRKSTHYAELAFLAMLQRCVVVIVVVSILLRAFAGDAPITWPDVRHFRASVDRQKGNALSLFWPVSEYCAENGLQNFSVSITRVGDGEFGMRVNRTSERVDIVLEQGEAEYVVVVEMKTKFNVHGVCANTSITTGGKLILV